MTSGNTPRPSLTTAGCAGQWIAGRSQGRWARRCPTSAGWVRTRPFVAYWYPECSLTGLGLRIVFGVPPIRTVLQTALSTFGAAVTPRLTARIGEPEDQLRGPFEALLATIASGLGKTATLHGEVLLRHLLTKPDYAVEVDGPLCGHIELKAPGVGADAPAYRGRNKKQWERLRGLPNLLYTDGNEWALYQSGERLGDLVRVSGDVRTSGAALSPPNTRALESLLTNFLTFRPQPPASAQILAERLAQLCRLLRDEVAEAIAEERRAPARSPKPFITLEEDWRALLFPDVDDARFADYFAQTVTFALLLAASEGHDVSRDLAVVARDLASQHGLLGRALGVLTDDAALQSILTGLRTIVRIISVVDWPRLAGPTLLPGMPLPDSPWLYFYETFLSRYDKVLRDTAGAYYTPPAVVAAQVRLVDDVLRKHLGKSSLGLADRSVVTLDPAMGTGSYLMRVVNQAAENVRLREGDGAVANRIRDLSGRLIGFEIMVGPYAVAEMLVSEAIRSWTGRLFGEDLRLHLTDTLDDPYVTETRMGALYEQIAQSHREANRVKREERVLVCVGNPPYDLHESDAAKGGWVVAGHEGQKPIWNDFLAGVAGTSAAGDVKPIYNLYAYFWRWALWKVFEAHEDNVGGVVAYITASSFLSGPGWAGVRATMRRLGSDIWVLDLGGEGHGARREENVFDIQTPVAITIVANGSRREPNTAARVRYARIGGTRADKLTRLQRVRSLDDVPWEEGQAGWLDPLLPVQSESWASMPGLLDLVPWKSAGIGQNRSWPRAPRPEALRERWRLLRAATVAEAAQGPLDDPPTGSREALLRETRDIYVAKRKQPLPGFPRHYTATLAQADIGDPMAPVRTAWRSFDRQWLLPDSRVLDMPRPPLWAVRSADQVYMVTQLASALGTGPAATFTTLVPDLNCFNNRGGTVLPLWRDSAATEPNLAPGLADFLTATYGLPVSAEDIFAYLAAVLASPAFTERFWEDLLQAGVRVPITAEPALFERARSLGRTALRLHTFGHFDGGGVVAPRIARVLDPIGARRPVDAGYDESAQVIRVGEGTIGPVDMRVGRYDVSGMPVIEQWLSYRKARPGGRRNSELDSVMADDWPAEWTTELLEVVWTLEGLVALEADQAVLLSDVVAGSLVTGPMLTDVGVLPIPEWATGVPRRRRQEPLLT